MKGVIKMKRLKERKGFTLAELLIVVAIVAVLVGISVPVFTSKLEKSRESVDVANMRAAKAVAVATYLEDGAAISTNYYDAVNGILVTTKPAAYGKGTTVEGGITEMGYDDGEAHTTEIIKVDVDVDGNVTLDWVSAS